MTPLRMANGQRELYASLSLPVKQPEPVHGVVFCNPLGQEAIRCHRMYRVLADRLNAAGLAVLRFDYFGTGDSAGNDTEGEPEGWVSDTLAACELLRSHSGCRDISLFGIRLGANLALRAAMRLSVRPHSVLMWDPIFDGKAYLQQLQRAHMAALSSAYAARWITESALRELQAPPGSAEALGFPMTAALEQGLAPINLDDCLAQAGTLLPRLRLWGHPDAALRRHHPTLQPGALGVDIDWMADQALNTPIAPMEIVRAVVDELGERDRH